MDADQLVDSLTEIGFIVYIVSVSVLFLTVNITIFNDIKQACILIYSHVRKTVHFCVGKCYFSIAPKDKQNMNSIRKHCLSAVI